MYRTNQSIMWKYWLSQSWEVIKNTLNYWVFFRCDKCFFLYICIESQKCNSISLIDFTFSFVLLSKIVNNVSLKKWERSINVNSSFHIRLNFYLLFYRNYSVMNMKKSYILRLVNVCRVYVIWVRGTIVNHFKPQK